MAPIRLGIIGLSADPAAWASMAHVNPLKTLPLSEQYKLTAVATSSEQSAKAAAKAHQIPAEHAYHSADDIANDPEVDMVVVSVKLPLHKELTTSILDAKKDVFVEWPLASNLQEAEELAAFAKKQGVRTAVGLQARNLPVVMKAKEMIDAGVLGRVTTTHVFISSSTLVENFPEKYRYFNDARSGANPISIATAHFLDPLCFLLGEFKSLNATTAITFPMMQFVQPDGTTLAPESRKFADSILVQGTLESGITVGLMNASTTAASPDVVEWTISGDKGSLKFSGKNSFLAFDQPKLYFYKADGGGSWEEVVTEVPAFGGIGPVYEAFASGKQGTYADFDDAVKRHKMVEAIYRSDERGTRETY